MCQSQHGEYRKAGTPQGQTLEGSLGEASDPIEGAGAPDAVRPYEEVACRLVASPESMLRLPEESRNAREGGVRLLPTQVEVNHYVGNDGIFASHEEISHDMRKIAK